MHPKRVAVIYDDTVRPETTGGYCLKALRDLTRVEHILPSDVSRISPNAFDLYLNIDDGLRYRLPPQLRPCAWWVIDTHMDPAWAEEKGREFDWLFAAQRDGAEQLCRAGVRAHWLPLACDPSIHQPHAVDKLWDLCFIGRISPGPRQELLALLRHHFPNSFIGQRYFDEFARTYSEARIGFNRSVKNDVNMRVFETLGCGTLLVTNDLRDNGQEELFTSDKHLVTYQGQDELVDKVRFYLGHDVVRERIARAGHAEALARHTYRHRMQSILETIESKSISPSRIEIANAQYSRYQKEVPQKWLNKIDFAVKTFLRPQALLRLLQSIAIHYPEANVTIADDGNLRQSDDPESRACCAMIDGNHRFILLSLPFAAGVTAGRNLLVHETTRPFLLFLDDDFCFTADTKIERLWERLNSDPRIGVAAGACMDVVDNDRRPRTSGGTFVIEGDALLINTTAWRDRDAGLRDYVPQFFLIRREVFGDVQWEGEIGGEHYDFCLQLQQSEWKVAQDLSVQIDHHHFTPALAGYERFRFNCSEAQQWLLRKWNLSRIIQDGQVIIAREEPSLRPDGSVASVNAIDQYPAAASRSLPAKDTSYFQFPRPEVVALIPASARRVLDIGCGAGRLGELLKQRQMAEVVGIELQPGAAAHARQRLDQVVDQSVEDPALDFPPGRFDCVVCADVLEHLREPAEVLTKIWRWLTPDGVLVASLPNVRHYSIVASLLQGNWTYESAGLLDSDHVRFFTRREIEKLLYRQQFEIQSWQSKPGPGYDEWHNAGRPGSVQVGGLNIVGLAEEEAQEFFTYQYLVVARPVRAKPSQQERLATLVERHPWPTTKPDVAIPTDNLGWFKEAPRELMRCELNPDTKLVVELGAWLGLSTRFIADLAPQARIITIDHWEGSREHRENPAWAAMLPTLYRTFLAMNWEYRDRIIPLKMTTSDGLRTIAKHGLKPDLIFIDADHSYDAIRGDLQLCKELFPDSRIIGDDYDFPDVQRAVNEFAGRHAKQVEPVGTGWRSWRFVTANPPPPRKRSEPGLTSIVIVTFNQLAYTKECVDSIRLRTDEPYELIFVDNGSTDGTSGYLKSLDGAQLIENADNRGFPAAVNQGLQLARGEYVVLLNNDTVVTTGWLRKMLEVFEIKPQVGLVGPCSNCVSGEQMVPVTYQDLSSLDGFAWDWGKSHHGVVDVTDRLIGFCLAVRRAVIDEIGLLDEQFGIGCFEDDDLCLRALRAGWKAVIARAAFVHHYGNRTFQGSGVDLQAVMERNREKFQRKWSAPSPPPLADGNGKPDREAAKPTGHASNDRLRRLNESSDLKSVAAATPSGRLLSAPTSLVPAPCFAIERAPNGGLLLTHSAPRLSLCMIVRDNGPTIRPCLESIRPWVDEIVIVDTGSHDNTDEICRQYSARMFHFPWCDDFSAARNESLRQAHGEWIFWMDSDDTITAECGRQLHQLADGPHDPKTLGYIMQVHCPGPSLDGENNVTVVDHVKLIRNRPDLRFEGRIHEQLLPAIRRAQGEVAWTDLYVVHSGSDHSPEGWQRKLERDLRILHRELDEQPQHPFVLFNLGMTYADAKRYGEAIQFLMRCLDVSQPEESHLRKAYALLVSSLGQAERHDEAWTFCQQGLAFYPEDKELLFRCAMLHHHFGRLRDAEHSYLRVLNGQEERHFSSIDRGLAGHKARHNLAIVYDEMGCLDRAEAEWRQIVSEVPDYLLGWRGLGENLVRQGKTAEAEQVCQRLAASGGRLHREAHILRARLAESRGDLQSAVREMQFADQSFPGELEPLRTLCRILFENGEPEVATSALRELTQRAPDDAAAHHNLGCMYSKQGALQDAVHCYRRSLELRPNALQTQIQLQEALQKLGMPSEIRPIHQQAAKRVLTVPVSKVPPLGKGLSH